MTGFTRFVTAIVTLAVATTLGCASGAPHVVAPMPVDAVVDIPPFTETLPSLELPDAAARVADRSAPTGAEFGTMWTFENPPSDYWLREYGFAPDAAWLEHVRLSSVRFGEYCSAAFVSGDGLVATNHHCARECIEAVSSAAADRLTNGFYAESREDERVCPGLYLDQLVAIEDVTSKLLASAAPGRNAVDTQRAITAASESIEDRCAAETGHTCQVVSFFQGARYELYQYKRYQPVKLVFAPELQAGYFGGDADNFTYPRHTLDVSFVRAYESGGSMPASTPAHLQWSTDGAKSGDIVFMTGNPGSTSRLQTVSQLMYERVYRHPLRIQILSSQLGMLGAYAAVHPDLEAQLRQDMFEVGNSLKAYNGQFAGLRDSLLVGAKARWERDFRMRLEQKPDEWQRYGNVWDRIEELQRAKLEVSPRLNVSNAELLGAPLLQYASELVQYVTEMARPEDERGARFRGAEGRQYRAALAADSYIDPVLARMTLAGHLDIARTWLSPDDPLYTHLFEEGESVAEAADRILARSKVLDADFRRWLMDAGVGALEESPDPAIVFARYAVTQLPDLWTEWQEIIAAEAVERTRLAQALFAVYGTSLAPDATFTLRISDGRVKGYEYNGTLAPPVTSFFGMFAKAAEFGDTGRWQLPGSFANAQSRINMAVPINFVATTDITGGNSGSPLIDRQGRLVGIAFDSNMEQLPNEFLFRPESGRTVAVHSAGVLEALLSVYRANRLFNELTGASAGSKERE